MVVQRENERLPHGGLAFDLCLDLHVVDLFLVLDGMAILVSLADPLPLTAFDLLLIGERILLGALQLLMKRISRCLMGGDQDADAFLKGLALHVEGKDYHWNSEAWQAPRKRVLDIAKLVRLRRTFFGLCKASP